MIHLRKSNILTIIKMQKKKKVVMEKKMHLIIVSVKEENSELSKRRLRRVERRSLKRTGGERAWKWAARSSLSS